MCPFNDVSYFVHTNFSIDYPAAFFKRNFVENVIAIRTVGMQSISCEGGADP